MAIPDSPVTREEQFLNRIATGDGAIPDVPLTRTEQYLDAIARNGSGGGGGESVPASTTTPKMDGAAAVGTENKYARGDHVHPSDTTKVSVDAQSLTDSQKAQARTNIGAEGAVVRETVSGATATIDAEVNTLYLCGTMTALTIDTFPPTGLFSVVFTSGATAATLTVPQTLAMPDGFTVEANKRYEINVMDGCAVVAEWSTS